jgi:hypothetical protein
MGNGWGIEVKVLSGPSALVTSSVECLANSPGATAQEVAKSVTVQGGSSLEDGALCPANSLLIGGGFSNANDQLYFEHFEPSMGVDDWSVAFGNSGATARTAIMYSECLKATGAQMSPIAAPETSVPLGSEQVLTAMCPKGAFASGGGFSFGAYQTVRLLSLAPTSKASGWSADLSVFGQATTVDFQAECLSFS